MFKQIGSFFAAAAMSLTLSVHTAHATGPGKVFRWKLKPGRP